MRYYKMYVCESCGCESRDIDVIRLCEGKHLGLMTLGDVREYEELKMDAEDKGIAYSIKFDSYNRDIYKKSIEALYSFEQSHNVPKNRRVSEQHRRNFRG